MAFAVLHLPTLFMVTAVVIGFSGLVLVSGGENETLAENEQLTEPGASPRK